MEPTRKAIGRWVLLGQLCCSRGSSPLPLPPASVGPSSARRPHTGSGYHADPGLPPADGPPGCAAMDKTPALSEHCILVPFDPAPDLEQLTADGEKEILGSEDTGLPLELCHPLVQKPRFTKPLGCHALLWSPMRSPQSPAASGRGGGGSPPSPPPRQRRMSGLRTHSC